MRPNRVRTVIVAVLIVAAGFGVLVRGADAHHPEVVASAVCAGGQSVVSIRSSSWETDEAPRRYNADVAVTFDGIAVGRGAFLPTNDYTFAVSYRTAADGRPHVVRATAAAPFGPSGEYGDAGAFREAIVTLPTACTTDSPTTTAAPSGSPTTTSSVVGSTTTSMSVVPVLVGGIVETRPESQAAVPIAALPRFAG